MIFPGFQQINHRFSELEVGIRIFLPISRRKRCPEQFAGELIATFELADDFARVVASLATEESNEFVEVANGGFNKLES